MPEANTEGTPAAERSQAGLENAASILQKLGKLLGAAVKSHAFGRTDYAKQIEEANRLAGQLDWKTFKTNLEQEASTVRDKEDSNLRSRREKLHQSAHAAQWHAQMGTQYDRIDIFQVEYEGATAVVKLGGALLERLRESDGEKLFERLRQLRTALEKMPFNREVFFNLLKAAHANGRRAMAGGDEFVPVRDLHREMVLERARASERFRKSAELKNIDSYSLPQFIYDLARFIREGVTIGGERIVTQTPSMRESKETVHIPNLDHPTSSEVAAARLAVKPA